jgi:hypothetical protein
MYVKAEDLQVPEAREALCQSMQADIRKAKAHFAGDFKRMLADMDMAMTGRAKSWSKDCYVVNVTQRLVRAKVAALYAKNPRAVFKRKHRLVYKYWDGDADSLMAAQMQLQMAAEQGLPEPPEAVAILQDVAEAQRENRLIERVGKTLEKLYEYYTEEQIPNFKSQMKRTVRAAVQCGVGYAKIGFQRDMDLSPENKAKLADMAQRLAHIERLTSELEDDADPADESSKEAEELRQSIKSLEAQKDIVLRSGLVFDWPAPTSVIPDPRCTSLRGWVNADWVAEEIFLSVDEIKELFNVDIGGDGSYTQHSTRNRSYRTNPRTDISDSRDDLACCWVLWHKPSGMKYTMVDGFKDFLEDPEPPEVTLERFFPIYSLVLNELEHPTSIFPPSDVSLIAPMQMELNRTREAVREHRMANRPGYVSPRGTFSEEDKEALAAHPPSAVIEMDNMAPGQKVSDMLQGIPKVGIDPNLYETQGVMNDVFLAVGASESTLGSTSGATATEASIAEANRTGTLEGDIDELNDYLTELARDAGKVLLMEHDRDEVVEIVGEGAIWPQVSQEWIQKEIYLSVVAGSNGRPNRARRQQALQQLMPFMLQVPGLDPEWMAKQLIESIDDSIDIVDAIAKGNPSVMMLNNQKQVTGAEDDPNNQSASGASNNARPNQPSQGAQPQGDRQRRGK